MLAGLGWFRLKSNSLRVTILTNRPLVFFFSFIVCLSQWSYVCLRFWVLQQASTCEQRKGAAERWTEQRDSRWLVVHHSKTSNDPPAQIAHWKLFSSFGPLFLLRWRYLEARFLLAKPVENFPLDCNFTSKGACGWWNTKETPLIVIYNISRFWQFSSVRRKTWRIFRLAWRLLSMGSKRVMRMQGIW